MTTNNKSNTTSTTNTTSPTLSSTTYTAQILKNIYSYLTNNDNYSYHNNSTEVVKALAYPGLITLLDIALYKSNEGNLTKTISSANVLLGLFIQLKSLSLDLLENISNSYNYYNELSSSSSSLSTQLQSSSNSDDKNNWIELGDNFARLCIECSMNVIERITTDGLSTTANLHMDNTSNTNTNSTQSNNKSADIDDNTSISSSNGLVIESINNMDYTRYNKQCQQQYLHRRYVDSIWESPRLYCPDSIWADDVYTTSIKVVKLLLKHRFLTSINMLITTTNTTTADHYQNNNNTEQQNAADVTSSLYKTIDTIIYLLSNTIPIRINQFYKVTTTIDNNNTGLNNCGIGISGSDSILLKRLYLIKCEYRAPIRCFFEAHATLQRAPRLELLHEYLTLHDNNSNIENINLEQKIMDAENKLSIILKNELLVNALKYEQECEIYEIEMAKMLYPFTELARYVDMKKGKIVSCPPFINDDDLPLYRELLRRLKLILTRKVGQETSTGIRPILLDLQGSSRDYSPLSISPFTNNMSTKNTATSLSSLYLLSPKNKNYDNQLMNQRLQSFTNQLDIVTQAIKQQQNNKKDNNINSGNSLFIISTNNNEQLELEIPSNIIRDCMTNLDSEMFIALYNDWYTMIQQQHKLVFNNNNDNKNNINDISEELRKAEIEVSIAKTTSITSLMNVKSRIEACEKDRTYKYTICQHLLKDICKREMNLNLDLMLPDKDYCLELPDVMDLNLNYSGIFGSILLAHGDLP